MKTQLLKLLKTLLVSFLIWFCLTLVFITLNYFLGVSEKFGWFPFVALGLPLFLALLYLAWAFLKDVPRPKKGGDGDLSASKPYRGARSTDLADKSSSGPIDLDYIDRMNDREFEDFIADLLQKVGYYRVEVTPGSGDQGVDMIAVREGKRYAIQCRRDAQKLGGKPVQEVYAGKSIFKCSVAVVLTNNYFPEGAEEAARATGVELWDRDTLQRMLDFANYKEVVQNDQSSS